MRPFQTFIYFRKINVLGQSVDLNKYMMAAVRRIADGKPLNVKNEETS